jgi:hypothetical protein
MSEQAVDIRWAIGKPFTAEELASIASRLGISPNKDHKQSA